ncbi:MAG: HupE/UreJ family protein [Pseudomonadota bacterium]
MSLRLLVRLAGAVALGLLMSGKAEAHALEPGYLEMQHIGGEEWRVVWRKPQVNGAPMPIDAVLPSHCAPRRGPAPVFDGRAFVTSWIAVCTGGLAGGRVTIEKLDQTRTDVLIRYSLKEDPTLKAARVTAVSPTFVVTETQGPPGLFASYLSLGVDHILKGLDHLLFVLVLLLLIRNWRILLGAVTAFTVAHSMSLAAASLGWVVVPAPPVEAIVALSIAFLAAEVLQPDPAHTRLSERYPWIVAFAFGLLHGLGFARALLDIGLPQGDVPLALLAFNLGVEIGQILFIALVLGLAAGLARLYAGLPGFFAPGAPGLRGVVYAVGTLAAFWTIERVMGFLA